MSDLQAGNTQDRKEFLIARINETYKRVPAHLRVTKPAYRFKSRNSGEVDAIVLDLESNQITLSLSHNGVNLEVSAQGPDKVAIEASIK